MKMAYNITELDGLIALSTQIGSVTSVTTPTPGTVAVSSSEWNQTFADHATGDPTVDVASTTFAVVDPVLNIVSYFYTYDDGSASATFYGVVTGYDATYDAFIIDQYSNFTAASGAASSGDILPNNHYTIVSASQDLSTVDTSAPTLPLDFAATNTYPAFLSAMLSGETLPSTVLAQVGPTQVIANPDGTFTVTGGASLDAPSDNTSGASFALTPTQTTLTISAITSSTKITAGDTITATFVSNGLNGEQPITASYKVLAGDVSGTASAGYHAVAVKLAAALNTVATGLGLSAIAVAPTGSSNIIKFITPTTTGGGLTFSGATVDVTATVSHTGGTATAITSTNTAYSSFVVKEDSTAPAIAGDVYSVTFQSSGMNGLALNGGAPYTVSYTVQASDVVSNDNHNIAVGLAAAINADANLQAVGITAQLSAATGITVANSNLVELYAPNALDSTVVSGSATSGAFGSPSVLVNEPTVSVNTISSVTGNGTGAETYQVIAYDQTHALLGYYDSNAGGITNYLLVADTSLDPSVVGNVGGTGQFTTPLTLAGLGSYVPPPCFTTGTHIATPGGETPVEMLRIGDMIMTAAGEAKPVKWLGRRGYDARAVAGSVAIQPVRIKAGAFGEGVPSRDLVVSPQHAMLIDGMFIPAAALVNDLSITRCRDHGDVTYIHIELDSHEAILAEGAATETFVDCDSRAMFENAAEFAALYPNHVATAPQYYAPRVESGDELEAVRRRLAARAGRRLALVAAAPGALRGHVERIHQANDRLRIEGWVQDSANPGLPVRLQVLVGGRVMLEVLANRYRSDLESAGLSGGRCAFDIDLPMQRGAVELRRACDGAVLPVAAEAAGFAMAA
jgi:hypothetical protein